jgi:hypothetical protein
METLNQNDVLTILAEAQKLLFRGTHWSPNFLATKQGEECSPWDPQADAWSSFGAIEKILGSTDRMRYLSQVVGELEAVAKEPLLTFDANHLHEEVIGLFNDTAYRLAKTVEMIVLTPFFDVSDEEEVDNMLFVKQADLDEMDAYAEEMRKRRAEIREEEHRLMCYDRD